MTLISMSKFKPLLIVLGICLFALSSPRIVFSAQKSIIVMISSKAIAPYSEAFQGFKDELKKSEFDVVFKEYDLDAQKEKKKEIANEVNLAKPDLIFTLGTEAALFAKNNFSDSPVIFSMVLNPVKGGIVDSMAMPGSKITGVALDIQPQLQFMKLKEALPNLAKVGVIYNAKDKDWIKDVEAAASQANLKLISKAINAETDVPRALGQILKEVECLWAQADPMIYNAQSAQYILLALLRSKIPFMAFSAQFVKAGAFLALECDYNDIGRQSGRLAIKMLTNNQSGPIPVVFPDKTSLIVNQKIADLIGITIPGKILREARQVY